jgi:hypothetical protein
MKVKLEDMSTDGVLNGKTIDLEVSVTNGELLVETRAPQGYITSSVWIEPVEGHMDLHAWDEKTDNNKDPTVSLRLLENINGAHHPEGEYHYSKDHR